MTLAMILAFLTGHQFQTPCVQTQDGNKSGYAVDSISFRETADGTDREVAVIFTRDYYRSADCKSDEIGTKTESGHVIIGEKSDGFFSSNAGEEKFDANWIFNGDSSKPELGAIGIDVKKSQLRISRSMPGFARNTMLQAIAYQGAKN